MEYKDTEGKKNAQCWTKYFSSLQSLSDPIVLYFISVRKASAGEQKAAFAMETGIPDKRSENTVWKGDCLLAQTKLAESFIRLKK